MGRLVGVSPAGLRGPLRRSGCQAGAVEGTRAMLTWEEVFEPFAAYVGQRLADDRHVWASTLFDEVVELGYAGSYPSFTRALRDRELRPVCPACAAGQHRESAIIDHPAG